MSIRVTNKTQYDSREVAGLVRRTLREMECDDVEVTVYHRKVGRCPGHVTGRYWPFWYPKRGQKAEQIRVGLPQPGTPLDDYVPYDRSGERGKTFPLKTWQEGLVAVVAHEGMHHKQTKRRGRFVEVECDLAAYRAWKRYSSASG